MTTKEFVFASLFVEKHKQLEQSGNPCTDGNCIEEAYRYAEECAEEFGRLLEEEKPRGEDKNEWRPIGDVITEIERIEAGEKKAWETYEHRPYTRNKGGIAARLDKIFRRLNIETLGDLLKMGKRGLRAERQVGGHSIDKLNKALFNLYQIKGW